MGKKKPQEQVLVPGLKKRYQGLGFAKCHVKLTKDNFAVGHQRNTRIHKIVGYCKKCVDKEPLDPLNVVQSLPAYERPEFKRK